MNLDFCKFIRTVVLNFGILMELEQNLYGQMDLLKYIIKNL